jgi:hypothetical protein
MAWWDSSPRGDGHPQVRLFEKVRRQITNSNLMRTEILIYLFDFVR